MQRTCPPGLCRAIVCLLMPLVFITSCTKDYPSGNQQSNFPNYLIGKPVPSIWILQSIQTGNQIDTAVQGAAKQYYADGTLADNLGYTGTWEIIAPDSLIEHLQSSVVLNAPYYTSRYHIDQIDTKKLALSYTISSQQIRLVYVSNK